MNAITIRRSLALAVVLFRFSVAAAIGATVYKWIDERGVTHYSQTPPSAQKAQMLGVESTPPSQSSEGDRTAIEKWREKNAEFNRRWEERKKAEEAEAKKTTGASSNQLAECDKAKTELARLMATKPAIKGRPTISLRDPQTGQEVELMNNAERTVRIHQAEEDIRKWCD
jgi:hypothetical protein